MRRIFGAATGLVLAAVFVLGVGILELQKLAAEGGGVLSLANELIGVEPDRPVMLFTGGIAAAGAVALAVIIGALRGDRRFGVACTTWFAVGSAALVALAVMHWLEAPETAARPTLFEPWALGWLHAGGLSSAVHVTVLAALLLFLMPKRRR